MVTKGQLEAWKSLPVDDFAGGFNTSLRPETIANNELITCQNVVIRKKKVQSDTGYKKFGAVVRGTPQRDFQFTQKAGTSWLVLITTASVYAYVSAVNAYQYIKGSASTTVATQANAGDTAIAVASISGFSDTDYVGIILDDGTQHQTRVNGVPGAGVITILNAIPTARHAAVGAVFLRSVVLTGDLDHQVSIVPVPSNDWLVFTNGVDYPQYFDGTSCAKLPNLPNSLTTCAAVALYNAALFLLNAVEGGTIYPQRIRRSDIGDPTNWTTNTAGYDDLLDDADPIMNGTIMGPYLIVYRSKSIARGQYVNTAGKYYEWDTTITTEGVSSTLSVVDLDSYHLVFGNYGVYSYTGGYDIQSIGDKIFYHLFSDEGELNYTYKHRIFALQVPSINEAWFFYPGGSATYPNDFLRYNTTTKVWSHRTPADNMVGYGFYQTISAKRWVDLVGSWDIQTWKWSARSVAANTPTVHLMTAVRNLVMEYDYLTPTDDGVVPVAVAETKDFFNKDSSMRHDTLECYLKGQSVLVEYSTDSGQTYETLAALSATELTIFELSRQFICDKIRYRFTCTSPGFELDWLSISYREEAGKSYRQGAVNG